MMTDTARNLQSLLVRMHYDSETVSHQMVHYMEHLFHLLTPEQENMVTHYFGIFGNEQLSLAQIARQHDMSEEQCMSLIDQCIHKLSITPEWQMLEQTLRNTKSNENNTTRHDH